MADVLFYGGLIVMGATIIVGVIHDFVVGGLDLEGDAPWWLAAPFAVGLIVWLAGAAALNLD